MEIKMKNVIWAFALCGMVLSLEAKSTLKASETLNAASLTDSVKKAAPKLLVKDTAKPAPAAFQPKTIPTLAPVPLPVPVIVPPVTVVRDTANRPNTRDSVQAKRFRISNRPMNMEEVKYFLGAFQVKPEGKPESTSVNMTWRDRRGALMSYETGSSEVAFSNESVPMLNPKDYVPDSLIRNKTDETLRIIMKGKSEKYFFTNYEITMVQKRNTDGKDSILAPVPAFYIGRYIRKLEDRVVLGDEFQIRMSYGEGGAIQAFSYRDPVTEEAGKVTIPSKELIMDSLLRWEKSKTHRRTYTYPYHPDHLKIRSIKPVKVFDSYAISTEKFRDGSHPEGNYLIPLVTVLAKVVVAPSKKKPSVPAPEEPILLHFHFPCQPAIGLCWPDGNQGIEDVTSNANSPAAPPATGNTPPSQGKEPISTPK
jgi:hypothetical protein